MFAEHTGIALEEGVEFLFFFEVEVFIGNLGIGWLLVGIAVDDGVCIILVEGIGIGGFGVECCVDGCDGDWVGGCAGCIDGLVDGGNGGGCISLVGVGSGGCFVGLVGVVSGGCFVGLVEGCEGGLVGSSNWTDLVLVDNTFVD